MSLHQSQRSKVFEAELNTWVWLLKYGGFSLHLNKIHVEQDLVLSMWFLTVLSLFDVAILSLPKLHRTYLASVNNQASANQLQID